MLISFFLFLERVPICRARAHLAVLKDPYMALEISSLVSKPTSSSFSPKEYFPGTWVVSRILLLWIVLKNNSSLFQENLFLFIPSSFLFCFNFELSLAVLSGYSQYGAWGTKWFQGSNLGLQQAELVFQPFEPPSFSLNSLISLSSCFWSTLVLNFCHHIFYSYKFLSSYIRF